MRRILLFLTVAVLSLAVLAGMAAADDGGKTMNENKYGLHVEKDGTVTLRGEPFCGFGVNYFGSFARYVDSENMSVKEFEEGLAGLASYNIPFIRIPLCGYSASYYDLYDSDPERVFGYMKELLDECIKGAKFEGVYERNKALFDSLSTALNHDVASEMDSAKAEICKALTSEIIGRYYYETGIAAYAVKHDKEIKQAIDLINDKERCFQLLKKR